MNQLVTALSNLSITENGDITYTSTGTKNLDLFALGSSLRKRQADSVIKLFNGAYEEDMLLAILNMFHSRNIRGGQGERKVFRTLLKHLATVNPELVVKLLPHVPYYGRWDDMLCLVDTSVWSNVSLMMKTQILQDFANYKKNESVSLLAKWLPSINTSSKKQVSLAKVIANEWFGNEQPYKQYRKLLAVLRKHLNILETKLCNKQYDFDYSKLSSNASLKYIKAFKRNDEERYGNFIDAVNNGEEKVNTGTLYPYDIYRKVSGGETEVDYLWNNLPNYCGDENHNVLVMADVSGSMTGTPMDMSVSLALYFAERIKGDFNHTFMTFSTNPQFVKIDANDSLATKMEKIEKSEWKMSTDLRKAFDMILARAVANNVPKEDMPSILLVISDMEFNQADRYTTFEDIELKYKEANYERPLLVFWNVNSRQNTIPTIGKNKVVLCSGASPITIKSILSGSFNSPDEFMINTLVKSGQYQRIIDVLK